MHPQDFDDINAEAPTFAGRRCLGALKVGILSFDLPGLRAVSRE
jgi:hypothetical protein